MFWETLVLKFEWLELSDNILREHITQNFIPLYISGD
jgi:hypothetical protein